MRLLDRPFDTASESSTMEGKNIKVYLRIRPISPAETGSGARQVLTVYPPQSVAIQDPQQAPRPHPRDSEEADPAPLDPYTESLNRNEKIFSFDSIFEESATQGDVFTEIGAPVVQSAIEGYNTCILAYGQTGSGKSYSMIGKEDAFRPASKVAEKIEENAMLGIIPRACAMLFATLDNLKTAEKRRVCSYGVELSCVEIYKEVVKCLVSEQSECVIRDHPIKGPFVHGATTCRVESPAHAMELLNQAFRRRTCAPTSQNKVSSRSHAICTFTITVTRMKIASNEQYTTTGTMHLVDLAGSERIHQTKADSERVKEAGLIGCSLLALGKVIKALLGDQLHVPYRDSQLTRLLKNALGGNSRTAMLTTVSPSSLSYTDTLHALFYADRVKSIRNQPHVNQSRAQIDMHAMQLELKRVQLENISLQRERMAIACPKDCDALLMRSIALLAPGIPIGTYLRRGFATPLEGDGGDDDPESAQDSSRGAFSEDFPETLKWPCFNWLDSLLILQIPEGWKASRRSPCCGFLKTIEGASKMPVYHQNTIVLTQPRISEEIEVALETPYVLIGGPEDHGHICNLHNRLSSSTAQPVGLLSPVASPTPSITEKSDAEKAEAPSDSQEDECFAVDAPARVARSTRMSHVYKEATQALFDAVGVQPESDLPSIVDVDPTLLEDIGPWHADGVSPPITGSSAKRLVSARRRHDMPQQMHLEKDSLTYALAYDAAKQSLCVLLDERPQQEALFGRSSVGSADTPESPQRKSIGDITSNRARKVLYEGEELFSYVAHYVKVLLEHRAKLREQAMTDVVRQAGNIQNELHQQLTMKTQRESELTAALQSTADTLTRAKAAKEETMKLLTNAEEEVHSLREELGAKDEMIQVYEKEQLKLSKKLDAMAALEKALEAAKEENHGLRADLARSSDEASALNAQVQVLTEEMLENISIATNTVSVMPDIELPTDIDAHCAGCKELALLVADAQTKLHYVEANRSAMADNINKRAAANAEAPHIIRMLKAEVRDTLHAVDCLKKDFEEKASAFEQQKAENKDLLARLRELLTDKARQDGDIKQLEAKLSSQIAQTSDAVQIAVHDERMRNFSSSKGGNGTGLDDGSALDRNPVAQRTDNTISTRVTSTTDSPLVAVQDTTVSKSSPVTAPKLPSPRTHIPSTLKEHISAIVEKHSPKAVAPADEPEPINPFIHKVSMADDSIAIQELASKLEKRSRMPGKQPEPLRIPGAPEIEPEFPSSSMQDLSISPLSPAMLHAATGGRYLEAHDDLDRHIMRVKEKVDRELAQEAFDPHFGDATSYVEEHERLHLNDAILGGMDEFGYGSDS